MLATRSFYIFVRLGCLFIHVFVMQAGCSLFGVVVVVLVVPVLFVVICRVSFLTHTHTVTHTHANRERERERADMASVWAQNTCSPIGLHVVLLLLLLLFHLACVHCEKRYAMCNSMGECVGLCVCACVI